MRCQHTAKIRRRTARTAAAVDALSRGIWKIPFQYEPNCSQMPLLSMTLPSTGQMHQYAALMCSRIGEEDALALYAAPGVEVMTAPQSVQVPGSMVQLVARPMAEF